MAAKEGAVERATALTRTIRRMDFFMGKAPVGAMALH